MSRTYTPEDLKGMKNVDIFLDGKQAFDVCAANPSEGWLEAYEHATGDVWTYKNKSPRKLDEAGHPIKRRYEGHVVVLGAETVAMETKDGMGFSDVARPLE